VNSIGCNLARRLALGYATLLSLALLAGVVLIFFPRPWLLGVVAAFWCAAAAAAWLAARRPLAWLRHIAVDLAAGAEQFASAACQMASSSQVLAQGASAQASALSDTAAASDAMAWISEQASVTAGSAVELMREAGQGAAEAAGALGELSRSMHAIDASSDKISRITKVIDEIAFQTNILALNAAVEAARAGAAGSGFAVVADEVRNLAQRSAVAARDIAGLIEESVATSKEGCLKLEEVTAVLGALVDKDSRARSLVEESSATGQQQVQEVQRIAGSLKKLEQLNQQAAASAEQTAATTQQVSAQAHKLAELAADLEALAGSAR